jgi:hypothetical protein
MHYALLHFTLKVCNGKGRFKLKWAEKERGLLADIKNQDAFSTSDDHDCK